MIQGVVAAVLATALVPAAGSAGGLRTFRSQDWGVTIEYPADLRVSTAFRSNYMDRGAWRVSYAAGTGPGTPIVAFALPDVDVSDGGGTGKATAELRVGASRDPDIVATCLTYGLNSGNNVESGTRRIGGITFTEVPDNSEGEMSKTISTDDFRAVHSGACYAIDLVVYVDGTSNRRPAFAEAHIDRLKRVLSGIRFD